MAEDVQVTIHGRDHDRASTAARDLGGAETIIGDLTIEAERNVVASAVEAGQFDIVVNAAGPFSEHTLRTSTARDWSAAYEANVISAVELSRAALPAMTAAGWGRIITLGTRGTRTPLPNMIEYSAAKAALEAATIAMAQDLAGTGITVNMVSPGVILTPGLQQMFAARPQHAGQQWDQIEETVTRDYAPNPTGRLGRPADIANLVTFLSSDAASYINGANIPVDGGITGTR